jgi:hypothetical protein
MTPHITINCPARCLRLRIEGERDARLEAAELLERTYSDPVRETVCCPVCGRAMVIKEEG